MEVEGACVETNGRTQKGKAADRTVDRLKDTKDPVKGGDAATELGISRQAVDDILKGKYCPSLSLVQRACEVWKMEFDFRGMLIKPEVFEKKIPTAPAVLQSEMIFEALARLDARSFEVIAAKACWPSLRDNPSSVLLADKTAAG